MDNLSSKTPFYKRWVFWLAAFIITPIVLVAIVMMSGSSQYAKELAALREQQLPTNIKQLEQYYAIPEGVKDSTEQWIAAIDSINEPKVTEMLEVLPYIGTPEPPSLGEDWPELETAKQFVSAQDETFRLIREAVAANGATRFDIDYSIGAAEPFENTSDLRQVARLLCLDSAVAYAEKDFGRVHQNTLAIFQIANALRYECTLLGQLIRNVLSGIATDQAFRYASTCNWNDKQLLSLQQAAARTDYRESYRRAEAGERAFGLEMMDSFPTAVTIGKRPQLQLLRFFDAKSQSVDQPWHECIEAHVELDAELKRPRTLMDYVRLNPFQQLTSSPIPLATGFARSVARQRCCIAVLAAERQRMAEGQASTGLAKISDQYFPKTDDSNRLMDPFNGQPLGYINNQNSIIVYSVGENNKDDHGQVVVVEDVYPTDIGFQISQAPAGEKNP